MDRLSTNGPMECMSLAWSADGQTLFAGYTDNIIRSVAKLVLLLLCVSEKGVYHTSSVQDFIWGGGGGVEGGHSPPP